VYVALGEYDRPVDVPSLIPENEDQALRRQAGRARQEYRISYSRQRSHAEGKRANE